MSKHTKGPWVWELVEGPQLVPEYLLKGPKVLCHWWKMAEAQPEPPDARLIAAAPYLLEAAKLGLKMAESWLTDRNRDEINFDRWMEQLQPVREAITKAGGE